MGLFLIIKFSTSISRKSISVYKKDSNISEKRIYIVSFCFPLRSNCLIMSYATAL